MRAADRLALLASFGQNKNEDGLDRLWPRLRVSALCKPQKPVPPDIPVGFVSPKCV
jgi:hypothetical protein